MIGTAGPQRRPGRPPNAEGRYTRARLLDAALELFARKGYAATSVREIADAVGVRDSAIYAHFAGKRDLYRQLVEQAGPGVLRQVGVEPDHLAADPPWVALPRLGDALVAAWDDQRIRLATSVLIRENLEGIGDALAQVRGQLGRAFSTWAAQGLLRDDVPVELLVWEFTSPLATVRLLFLHGQASPEERRRGRELARQHVDYFVRTAAAGDAAPHRPGPQGGGST